MGKYEESLERAKSKLPEYREVIEYIFPDLKKENEDERIRKALIDGFTVMKESKNCGKTFSNHDIPVADILAWLEKQGEPKQEWSEEDKYTLGEIIQHLKELIRIDKAKHCSVDMQYYQRDIDWLKSLKERYTWKPSDKQINALSDVLSIKDIKYDVLSELLECLKKLI